MSHRSPSAAIQETRQKRIEAIMKQRRPNIEQAVRQRVEHVVDVPQAQQFGDSDSAFRDAGPKRANQVRQASRASRKKRATYRLF